MIPTYNCASLLMETLDALKRQTLDISQAQIEVIDDCSTKDKPEDVVREAWDGRVDFFRQPKNVTATPNFNTCIERAQRGWVYILHGDDFPAVDGLEALNLAADSVPQAEVLLARVIMMDAIGVPYWISDRLGPNLYGILEISPSGWRENPTQFVSTIVKKRAYVEVGPFSDEFVHTADFWMWWQLASTRPTAYTNRIAGYYRSFEGNHSSSLRREAVNIAESIEVLKRIGEALFGSVEAALAAGHFRGVEDTAYRQALEFLVRGDRQAYVTNLNMPSKCGIDVSGRLHRAENRRKAGRVWQRLWPFSRSDRPLRMPSRTHDAPVEDIRK